MGRSQLVEFLQSLLGRLCLIPDLLAGILEAAVADLHFQSLKDPATCHMQVSTAKARW